MPPPPRSSLLRRFRWLIVLAVLAGAVWAGHGWLVSAAQTRLNETLKKRGLVLKSSDQSWSVFGGIRLKNAALCRLAPGHEPLVEISQLQVDLLWRKAWAEGAAITRWRAKDATLILHDREGAVQLDNFTTDFLVRKEKIELARLKTRNGPLVFDLEGQISTAVSEGGGGKAFELNLGPLRSVLNTMRFDPTAGPFMVTGNFSMDLQQRPAAWQATVRGKGHDVIWRGLPLPEALLEGRLAETGLELAADLKLMKGGARLDLIRDGWSQTPLEMKGTVTDSTGRSDTVEAAYLGSKRTLTVARLEGPADLVELGRTFPPLAERIPAEVDVKKFPDVLVRDFVWSDGPEGASWSLKSLQLTTPAILTVLVRDKPLPIHDLTGQISRQGETWHFHRFKGQLLGGSFALDGDYDGKILDKAEVSLNSLRLARLSPWLGKISSSLDDSDLTLTYRGSVCGGNPVRSTGSGTLVLTQAPVVHIPLLEQTYALFPKLLPDRGKDGTGEFQVTFSMNKGVATIDPFKGRSQALTVTATGTVDLVKRRIEGKARANLRGVVGVVTSPLSHVLTDMEISGPLDDIRVSSDGPVSGARKLLKGTTKAATGSVKLSTQVLGAGLTLPFEALGMFRERK